MAILYSKLESNLSSVISKLFAKCISNRITPRLNFQQPDEQAGCRKEFSTTDHLLVMRRILEEYSERKEFLVVAFIDYIKAFDTLEHCYICKYMIEQGVDHQFIRLIRNVYNNATAKL